MNQSMNETIDRSHCTESSTFDSVWWSSGQCLWQYYINDNMYLHYFIIQMNGIIHPIGERIIIINAIGMVSIVVVAPPMMMKLDWNVIMF